MAHCPECGAQQGAFLQNPDGSYYCLECGHNKVCIVGDSA